MPTRSTALTLTSCAQTAGNGIQRDKPLNECRIVGSIVASLIAASPAQQVDLSPVHLFVLDQLRVFAHLREVCLQHAGAHLDEQITQRHYRSSAARSFTHRLRHLQTRVADLSQKIRQRVCSNLLVAIARSLLRLSRGSSRA